MSAPPGTVGRSSWHFQTSSSSLPSPSQPTSSSMTLTHSNVSCDSQGKGATSSHQAPLSSECLPKTCVAPSVRSIFSFDFFNRMQSTCFHALYDSWDNCVIGAPTAAGKTVCFELALAAYLNRKDNPRAPLHDSSTASHAASTPSTPSTGVCASKATLYLAPLKSLVQERLKDWRKKLQPLGVMCQELTGDRTEGGEELLAVNSNVLYLATPERWDSITRKWKENEKELKNIGLILVDEVHLLGDDRGAVLESVIARTLMLSGEHPPRIIALSASSPNVSDIGKWLKAPSNSIFYFGEEHRPITPEYVFQLFCSFLKCFRYMLASFSLCSTSAKLT